MRESDFWKYIRKGLIGKCHITRIESSAGNGVPDVSIGLPGKSVWVELKVISEWPVRPTTKVKLPLRPEQKHWIRSRGAVSGNVWALCRVQSSIFLVKWTMCQFFAETGCTKEDWYHHAFAHWEVGKMDFDDLLQLLQEG